MLDHKIKELKKQIEPKDDAIADMKEQIKVRPTWLLIACAELASRPL